jgi:hypothetical protein
MDSRPSLMSPPAAFAAPPDVLQKVGTQRNV